MKDNHLFLDTLDDILQTMSIDSQFYLMSMGRIRRDGDLYVYSIHTIPSKEQRRLVETATGKSWDTNIFGLGGHCLKIKFTIEGKLEEVALVGAELHIEGDIHIMSESNFKLVFQMAEGVEPSRRLASIIRDQTYRVIGVVRKKTEEQKKVKNPKGGVYWQIEGFIEGCEIADELYQLTKKSIRGTNKNNPQQPHT